MLSSTDRILTTHVGSLPRNEALADLLIRQEAGETIDPAVLASQIEAATAHVVASQVKAGVDIGNDGEQSRVGFQTYVPRCMCGFGGEFEATARPRSARVSELRATDGGTVSTFGARCQRPRRALGGAVRQWRTDP